MCLSTEKTPKRTYRSPGNVSELVDAPPQWRNLAISGGTPGRLDRDRRRTTDAHDRGAKQGEPQTATEPAHYH